MSCRAVPFLHKLAVAGLSAALGLTLAACSDERPLKIGYIGGLSGRVADLGIAGRDGVIMAVEERNRAGGIAGRKLELVVRDDQQKTESAKRAIEELSAEQVAAIIGPMTSSMAVTVKPMVDSAQTVLISPTAKTTLLSAQDDFFFRVTTSLSRNAQQLAEYIVDDLNLQKIAVVYDLSNRDFTENWFDHFTMELQAKGAQVIAAETFTSQPEIYFMPIAERVLAAEPEGVLLISNAIDTALFAQQIRKLGSQLPLFSSEWAFTTDLLSFGGRAVNGMRSFHSFNVNSDEAAYLDFKRKFTKRFGYEPSFATVLAHDAATCLFAGLERNPAREGLKPALLSVGTFAGLQSQFVIDRFGDVDRKLFLTVVDDSHFKVVALP